MSAWIEKYINVNQFARSGKKLNGVRKLVIHYTANNGGTAENHYRYFNNLKDRYASAHIFVDKTQALCIIPLDEVAYHANDVQKRNADGTPFRGVPELLPNANLLSIGVEMCMEYDGSFHPDMIARTEDVFVELCRKYNLNPLKDIVMHFNVTRKNCPAPWVSNFQLFEDFKGRVNAKLNGGQYTPQPAQTIDPVKPKPAQQTGTVIGRVKVIVDGLNIRQGDGTNFPVVGKAVNGRIYDVYAYSNDWHLIGANQWVFGNNGQYLSLIKDEPAAQPVQQPTNAGLTVGQKVTLLNHATHYATGQAIPASIKNNTYTIQQVGDGKVLLKEIVSWVWNQDVSGGSVQQPVAQPQPQGKQLVYNRSLSLGSKGNDVRELQEALNKLNFKCGNVDGVFGKLTLDAVLRFQKVYIPREVVGIAGRKTIAKINELL